MTSGDIQRLADLLEELVRSDGAWKEKANRLKAACNVGDLEEFLSWFEEDDFPDTDATGGVYE